MSTDKKLEVIDQRLYDLAQILSRNTEILNEHHRRTTLNEQRIEYIERHVVFVNSALKVISVLLGGTIALHQLGFFTLVATFINGIK